VRLFDLVGGHATERVGDGLGTVVDSLLVEQKVGRETGLDEVLLGHWHTGTNKRQNVF
jgi:hypothetical protein